MAMITHAPCNPDVGNDHQGTDHLECLMDWYPTIPLNTMTCLTNYDAVVRGKPEHGRCGPHCPGPQSAAYKQSRKLRAKG